MKNICKLTAAVLLLAMIFLLSSCQTAKHAPLSDLSAYPAEMAVSDDISQTNVDAMENWISAIETLLDKCAEKNYQCDYERAKLSIIKYYYPRLLSDKAASISDRVLATVLSLNTIYTETLKALISYLEGTAEPLSFPSYDVSTLTISGANQYAVYENGQTAAVYLIGHGHWQNSDMIEWFPSFGQQIIQLEIGVDSYIVPRGEGSHEGLSDDDMFDYSLAGFDRFKPFMEAASEVGVTVSLLISPHYFPSFLYDLYPDLPLGSFAGFIKYSVNHPVARRAVEVYLNLLTNDIKGCDAISDICLSNEPMYYPISSQYDAKNWPAYLENMFTTIENFNKLSYTSYDSFEDVPLRPGNGADAFRYAYNSYACDIFTGWHEWMATIIRNNSSLPITAKIWGGIGKDCYSNGIDLVRFAEFCDLMGCDGYAEMQGSYFDNAATDQLWNKFMWYDLLHTISGKPVYNMEDHVCLCTSWFKNEDEVKAFANHIYSDMFGGALHGRAASIMWTWVNTHDSGADTYGGVNMRPLALDRVAKASLDTAKMSPVIEAFVNDKPDVYILYSPTSLKYTDTGYEYSSAYRIAGMNTGLNVAYIAENKLPTLPEDAVVIVPGCNYVSQEVFDNLKTRANAGKLVLLGGCLKYSDMGVRYSADALNELYAAAYVFKGYTDSDRFAADTVLRSYLISLCSRNVTITCDGSSINEPMLLRSVEYNGRTYVHAVLLGTSYGNCGEYDNAQICVNGKPVAVKNELDNTYCRTFALKQFQTVFFSFEN